MAHQKINFPLILALIVIALIIFGSLLALVRINTNPEISNINYTSLKTFTVTCYPDVKKDIRKALANDDKILEDEYYSILKKCNNATNKKQNIAKEDLKKAIK